MTEKKVKFTWIDALIILIVIAAAAIAAVKFAPSLFAKTEKSKTEFTILISEKDESLAEAMSAGDRVTLSLTENDGGVIKDIKTEPAELMVFDSIAGAYKIQELEDKRDIYVTVEADSEITELAVKTGDTKIRVGEQIPVRGKGYAASGYIIEVDEN